MMNRLLIIMVVLSLIDRAFSYLGNAHRSVRQTTLKAEKEVRHNCDNWHGNKYQSYIANGNTTVFRYQCRISITEIQLRSILDSL